MTLPGKMASGCGAQALGGVFLARLILGVWRQSFPWSVANDIGDVDPQDPGDIFH